MNDEKSLFDNKEGKNEETFDPNEFALKFIKELWENDSETR